MIDKSTIVVASLGRTGTRFFSVLFREILPDATSLHEPDTFHLGGGNGVRRLVEQTRRAGAYNMFVRKALGRWGLVRLSHARVQGRLDLEAAARQVLDQRGAFVRSQSGSVYVESSLGYYGLIDVLPRVYGRHRAVYIVRDGREWVRSKMNRPQMYGRGKLRGLFAHRWPVAFDFEGDAYRHKWAEMSRFERLCWAWNKLNGYALQTAQENENARVFRFEDVFVSPERYRHLRGLVDFAIDLPLAGPMEIGPLDGRLDQKVNVSSGLFPPWEAWQPEQKRHFEATCGSLMGALGYGLD